MTKPKSMKPASHYAQQLAQISPALAMGLESDLLRLIEMAQTNAYEVGYLAAKEKYASCPTAHPCVECPDCGGCMTCDCDCVPDILSPAEPKKGQVGQ